MISIGSSVRINSRCTANGRTGVVTLTSDFWTGRGFARVEFDPKPDSPSWAIVPIEEAEAITASERQGMDQGDLFGVAP